MIPGIDVSAWQGAIDWKQVASSGVKWAYAKATEGTASVDGYGEQNIIAAKGAGVPIGSYHFFRPKMDPKAQAEFFLATTQNRRGTLTPMVDVETPGLDADAYVDALGVFVETVEGAIGRFMLIYASYAFWNEQLAGSDAFSGHPRLWVAAYSDGDPENPNAVLPSGWKSVTAWQYSSSLQVPGIAGNVDGDRLYLPLSELTL
jgi:lysozyme